MSFNAGLLVQYAPELLSGLLNTIWIWLAGSAIALVVGCILGIALTFGPRGLRISVRCYVEFFRGTPLLA
jgi:His/Glu/Gln/Arg/opine family amino acid ABC transporter permease subunit